MLIKVGQLEVPVQLCIFFFCCIGPVMVVVGSVLLSLSVAPDRENAITNYNLAAETFQTNIQEFRATPFSLFGNYFGEVLNEVDQLSDTGDFSTYSPFKYLLEVPVDNVTAAEILIDVESPYLHQFYVGVVPSQRGFNLPQGLLGCRDDTVKCTRGACLKQPLCSTYCASQNGVWSNSSHTCAVTHYLQEICVKVSQASSSWILDSRYGGSGCFYKGKASASAEGNFDPYFDPWSPFLYLKDPQSTINFTIRHASDPQIYASFQTSGTFNFGEPVSEKIVPGIVILAIGAACLVIVPIAVFYFVKWLMKHERGVKKSYRNGGLEKMSSMDVRMQEKLFEHPSSSPPHKVHLPPPHIFDIYVSGAAS